MISLSQEPLLRRGPPRWLLTFSVAASLPWLPIQMASAQAVDGSKPAGGTPSPGVINGDSVTVSFPNSPVAAIIPFYSQLTGKKMILDAALQGESLRIIGTRPLSKREAVAFIESSLLLNGYAVLPMDEQTVKLIHHSGGKNPRSEGLPVITTIRELPEGEQIVNYVMPLSHISPEEATKAFQQVVQLHAYGSITPIANASAIIITESTTTIRSLANLASVIDVSPAEIANEMIKLERSDAESIATIIRQIYEEKEKPDTTAPSPSAPALAPMPAQAGKPGVQSTPMLAGLNHASVNPSIAKVKIIPYNRTNQLLVIARPVDIAYIKGLVAKLDQKGDGLNFMKRKLRYIAVNDFLSVAQNALARDTDIQGEGGGAGGGGQKRPRNSTNSPSTDASKNSRGDGQGTGSSSSSRGGGGNRSVLSDPDQGEGPNSIVVGKTLLIADPQSNSLIVSGSTEHVNVIDQLLNEIDVRPQQIYINTLIGHLNLGDSYKIGFDMLRLLDDFTLRQTPTKTTTVSKTDDGLTKSTSLNGVGAVTGAGLVNGQTATDGVVNNGLNNTFNSNALGNVPLSNSGQAATAAGLIEFPFNAAGFNISQLNLYGQIGALGRYVNLLQNKKNFKVLSRPSVYTMNNRKAVISSGQRIAVPVNTLANSGPLVGNTASVSSSIEYRDVLLKLEVIPLINSDNEVTLRIAQMNDNIVGEQNVSGNAIPTIGTQELVTTITVKNGETVVLGGLITETHGKDRRGVPILSSIPLIKYLFSVTEKKTQREELLIFIQPNIVGSRGNLDTPNRVESGRSDIMRETLDFGNQTRGPIPKAIPVE
jgi:general secretion pathway protein D